MRWNIDLDNELRLLIKNHHNYDEISKKMNLSLRSVQNRAFRLGLKVNLSVETFCSNCGGEIKRFRSDVNDVNNFCSKSCAATFNNRNRVHSEETKEKIRNKLRKNTNKKEPRQARKKIVKIKNRKSNKIYPKKNQELIFNFKKIKKCGFCDNLIPIKNKICDECKLNYYNYYRPLCEFNFNLADYPNEFDFTLIENHGWYSASNRGNNTTGISRDHMYSVRDGFINKINPDIIKHPANCRLMIHNENNKKHSSSTITIGELLERIKEWDLKYEK